MNHGGGDLAAVTCANLFQKILGEAQPQIHHGGHDGHRDLFAVAGGNQLNGFIHPRHPAAGKGAQFHRYQHPVGSAQGVERQYTQGRRAVDHAKIVVGSDLLQMGQQTRLALTDIRQQMLHGRQRDGPRQQVHSVCHTLYQHLGNAHLPQQYLIQTVTVLPFQPHAQRGMTLRVQIHQQYPLAALAQTGGQVDRRGCFAAPALLVGNGNDFHQSSLIYSVL